LKFSPFHKIFSKRIHLASRALSSQHISATMEPPRRQGRQVVLKRRIRSGQVRRGMVEMIFGFSKPQAVATVVAST
jgi:hypothetical protein